MSRLRVGVLEHVVDVDAEHAGDPECQLQGRRVPALLDGDDGLPGHADPVRELGLRHLTIAEAQCADGVRDAGGLHHWGRLRRYTMTLVAEPRIEDSAKHR